MNNAINNNKGFAALVIVIVIAAATLLIAYTASIIGLGELEMGAAGQKGSEAMAIANGCVEESLQHLRINQSYSGGNLSFGAGSCIIAITTAGSQRTINVTGTVGQYNKKVRVLITLTGNVIGVDSWEEVSS